MSDRADDRVVPRERPRRLSTAQRAQAKQDAAIAEATRLAGLLASAPIDGDDPLAPPAFILDPRLAPALTVWRELVPQLATSGRLHRLDRDMFAALCYWRAEWITAVDDILTNGYSFMANATSGGKRPWANPAVDRRDTAWNQMTALSAKFGLTPLDRIALAKAYRDGNLDDPDLFPAERAAKQSADRKPGDGDAGEVIEAPDSWGSLLDQSPPRLN